MGKFDLDDVLRSLGEPHPDAPVEPSPSTGPPAKPFVRQNPKEIPRPPDLTGEGLGEPLNTQLAANKADPARLKPNNALSAYINPNEPDSESEEHDDLGRLLVARGIIDNEQLAGAQRLLKQTPGKNLVQVLGEMGIDETALQSSVAERARLPFERIDLEDENAYDLKALHRLGAEFCRDFLVIPLRRQGSRVVVGTTSPDDVFLLDDVKRRLGGVAIKHVLVTGYDIRGVIETLTEAEAEDYDVDELLADVEEDDVEVVEENTAEADIEDAESSPVVRYVNHIIQTALKEGASDIHIEPDDKTLKVRFRIDGVLFDMMSPPKKMHAAITSRIKIMANLDIAERRLPQDGRIRVTVLGRKLDLRVSTIPTPKGEKTVLRILDTRSINVAMEDLGFSENTLDIWRKQIDQPHGIILVTGPTGSGKTTTLYASIRQMDLRKLNVSTVEDPVEYNLSGITQIQTHERIGMTFATALKALLRQDPDVIMLGEIRDMETSTTAIQAALTGHLVLSTLHTNDAPSSVTRLINIGVEPFLVGAALNAVLAQRLTRRICTHCRKPAEVTPEIEDILIMHDVKAEQIMTGSGCNRCRETGYSGRVGLYEMLLLDDFLRDKIAGSPNVTEFRRLCIERGMVSLRQDGFEKVARGLTTVEEILRVTQSTI